MCPWASLRIEPILFWRASKPHGAGGTPRWAGDYTISCTPKWRCSPALSETLTSPTLTELHFTCKARIQNAHRAGKPEDLVDAVHPQFLSHRFGGRYRPYQWNVLQIARYPRCANVEFPYLQINYLVGLTTPRSARPFKMNCTAIAVSNNPMSRVKTRLPVSPRYRRTRSAPARIK